MNDFFYYIKSDRRAIFVLSVVGLVLLVLNLFLLNTGGEEPDEQSHRDSVMLSLTKDADTIGLHKFDPNTADSFTLSKFGIKPAKIKILMNYRRKVEPFRTPDDIRKLYTWTDEEVDLLLPYIEIDAANLELLDKQKRMKSAKWSNSTSAIEKRKSQYGQDSTKRAKAQNKFSTLTKIDPNKADTALLRRIPGIGAGISKSIIEYRERLGGFVDESQLLEIKIFSPELLVWFEVENSELKLIPLNTASFHTLNSHPYISYEQTRSLLRYIRLYGKINNKEILQSTNIFTTEELEKVLPYLNFSE